MLWHVLIRWFGPPLTIRTGKIDTSCNRHINSGPVPIPGRREPSIRILQGKWAQDNGIYMKYGMQLLDLLSLAILHPLQLSFEVG